MHSGTAAVIWNRRGGFAGPAEALHSRYRMTAELTGGAGDWSTLSQDGRAQQQDSASRADHEGVYQQLSSGYGGRKPTEGRTRTSGRCMRCPRANNSRIMQDFRIRKGLGLRRFFFVFFTFVFN